MKLPFRRKGRPATPAEGYDQWSATYDTQPNNAVLALESALFTLLISRIDIENKTVVDVGCGTGRHWNEILGKRPLRLFGVDASEGMLTQLKARHPGAEVIHSEGDRLSPIADESVDVIISNLALAHIKDPARALKEWTRILRRAGSILITDFHADAERAGMKRTFAGAAGTVEIEQHAIPMDRLRSIVRDCGLEIPFTSERAIDEFVRSLFQGQEAERKYEQHLGLRLVYGVHLTKP